MKAFIFVGGEIFPEEMLERPDADCLTIAADSGYENARALGVKPHILVGDMDSIDEGILAGIGKETEILRVKPEKDLTDTQLAAEVAVSRGADDITIVGGFGGRVDHELSNLAVLEDLKLRRIHAVMVNGHNRARFLVSTSTLIARTDYRYLSLIAADPVVKGVEIQGCKYPLKNAKLKRSLQFAVSNEITGNCALIAVRKGAVWIIESK